MTPFPVGPSRIGKDRHGAVAQRQRIPFATGRSRVRIPPAPPDGSSRGAPDKAPVRTDSHHALEKAMGGTVTPRFLPRAGGGVSRSPVRIRLGALGRRPRRLAVRRTRRPGARRHGRLPLRRWCNGKHGGLQNRRSGFESRPACDAAILLFGPSGLRLRGRMATVSECGAVGSARGWGPRGRGFESRHSDARKPTKTELARMRAKYAAWLERDRRLSRLAAERRRKRLGGDWLRRASRRCPAFAGAHA